MEISIDFFYCASEKKVAIVVEDSECMSQNHSSNFQMLPDSHLLSIFHC